MIAIRFENQEKNMCCSVNKKPIWYDLHIYDKYYINCKHDIHRDLTSQIQIFAKKLTDESR